MIMIRRDTPKTGGMRRSMVEELERNGFGNAAVREVMGRVPRHLFLDSAFEKFAYRDQAFEIGEGQTISRPATVAQQSVLLETFPNAKVLEVGTGSGYQAAVLDGLGCSVYSIERQKNLYLKTRQLLSDLNTLVQCFYGDGYKGLPQFAPFDRILITCGAPFIPQELVGQLKVGGIMVVPVGDKEQIMTKVVKVSETEVRISEHGSCNFVPMLGQKAED